MPYKDLEKRNEVARMSYHRHKEKRSLTSKRYRIKLRKRVLEHYSGGVPKCECCGELNYEFLSLDHIDGGGTIHREKDKISNLDRWLIQNNFPEGYRVLCHNCNMSMGIYGYCPHQLEE